MCGFGQSLPDQACRRQLDKLIPGRCACALREPTMYPLARRSAPAIATFDICLDTKKNLHPNARRALERMFPIRNTQRNGALRRFQQCELVFAAPSRAASRIVSDAGLCNVDGIDFVLFEKKP